MIEQLTEVMVATGAAWVLYLLFLLSIASAAVAIERLWVLRSAEVDLSALLPALRAQLQTGSWETVSDELARQAAVASRVAGAGLAEARRGRLAVEEAIAAASGLERRRLERRLIVLGTVGNNAPFIGLLGTVIGVVGAFEALGAPAAMADGMNASSALAPDQVMSAIAEALVATAVGLIVAIPAVATYNYLQTRVDGVIDDANTLGHIILSHLGGNEEH